VRSRLGVLAGMLALAVVAGAGLAGCVTKGDVQMVQGEVALLRADVARRDSARAADLDEVLRLQRQVMDSLTSSRRAVAQLTGQSQQRLTELRTRLEARGAQMEAAPSPVPGDSARPVPDGGTASADQMYEASLAQLRRGSLSTARLGLREMLRLHPTSERAPDALYFIGQSFAAENPDSAAAYYRQVVDKHATSPRAASALYNLGLLAERRKDTAGARDAYQRVAEKYPQSDEAALARDRLKALGR
jgi:tol-pal system protein YbgF